MSNLHKSLILLTVGLLTPATLFAATSNIGFDGLNNLILSFANGVVRSTGYMMFTLAVVVFFFGIVQFIWTARQGAEGKGIQKGTQFIKWGLIAIFIMFSLWGIIRFTQGVFGIQGEDTITVPSLNFRPANGGATGVDPITGSQSPNAAFNACIAAGGGSGECRILSGQSTTNPTSGGSTGGTSGGSTGSGSGSGATYTPSQVAAQQQVNNIVSAINDAATQIAAKGGDPNQIGTTPAECVARGGNASTCQAAFGTPVTGSTGDAGFDSCISAGGGVAECRNIGSSYAPGGTYTGDNIDAGGGWNPASGGSQTWQQCMSGGGTLSSCQGLPGQINNSVTENIGGDYGPTVDYGTESWQTTGNGFDNTSSEGTQTAGDYGPTVDYGTESWQTTGNGFDYVDTQTTADSGWYDYSTWGVQENAGGNLEYVPSSDDNA